MRIYIGMPMTTPPPAPGWYPVRSRNLTTLTEQIDSLRAMDNLAFQQIPNWENIEWLQEIPEATSHIEYIDDDSITLSTDITADVTKAVEDLQFCYDYRPDTADVWHNRFLAALNTLKTHLITSSSKTP